MRNIAKVMAIGIALTAFPALAGPLDDHDPFSQGYVGRDPEVVRAEREREQKKASPCDMSCPCGHAKMQEKTQGKTQGKSDSKS